MGKSITRDALYTRVEWQHKKRPNKTTRPVKELAITQNDPEISSISSPSTDVIQLAEMLEVMISLKP